MARNGPEDFHEQHTQHALYGQGGRPPSVDPSPIHPPPEQTDYLDSLDQEIEPTPWYRRPVMLTAWIVVVLILIALIIFGILELLHGEEGTSNFPTTSSTSTTTTTTSSTPTTTTPTTTPSPTTSAAVPPPQQPTYQPTEQPTQRQQAPHHHHLPHLPSVITIPEVPTVITLPPGLP